MEAVKYTFKKPAKGKQDHEFHLVPLSPWPILASLGFLLTTGGAAFFFHDTPHAEFAMIGGLIFLLYIGYRWWKDCINEGAFENAHTSTVRLGLRMGMALFITSEIMFFFAFFFSFFSSAFLPIDLP